MREDHRILGADAARQVVDHHVQDVVMDVSGGVAIGDHLIVGDDDVGPHALVLEAHALLQRAEVMPQMQAPGRAVSGEHDEARGVLRELLLDLIAHLLLRQERIRACHV